MAKAAHPTARTFLTVGLILFLITAAEFAIVYLEGMRTLVLTVLLFLSVAKFYLVASYFMHLRFDHKLLSWTFAVGVLLALLITVAQKYVNLA